MRNRKFVYKENDEEGLNTLNAIAETHHFNKWMYEAIQPYLKGEILEIGSGIGNITQYVVDDGLRITASDIRVNYCDVLTERFGNSSFVEEVRNIDIVHPDFDTVYLDIFGKFDSVVALNAIEHIENHHVAVANCKKLLKAEGRFIVLVPAFMKLYNGFDKELHHFRRYTKKTLEQLLSQEGFLITKTKYFNVAGIFGWWFSGTVLKNRILPPAQLFLFNRFVSLFKILDRLSRQRLGLSVISVGTKRKK